MLVHTVGGSARCGAFAVGLVAMVLTGCHRAPVPVALDCRGGAAIARPSTLTLACGDGTISAVDLSWSRWTSVNGKASGAISMRDCEPDCAHGKARRFPAEFVVHDPHRINGRRYFTRVDITFAQDAPRAKRTVSCPLSDPQHDGGCVAELTG